MMNTKRILIWLLVVASGWLAACSSAASSQPTPVVERATEVPTAVPTITPVPQSPDPLTVVQNFYSALNAGDADAVAVLLADDITWRGTPYLTGKASVMTYLESTMNGTWVNEISDMRVTRKRVTHTIAAYRNDVLQFGGEETMVVVDGLITAVESYAGMGADTRPDIVEVAFTASDSGFTGPEEIAAGWVRINLTNEGQEGHHIQLVRLAEGKTPDDLKAALTADPESYPDWAEPFGGPNAPDPGGATSAIVYLEMGSYVLIDIIPDAEGVPHFQNGLIKALTVTEPPRIMPGEPLPDVTINLSDFHFEVSGTFAAGEQTIRF
jgi:limonene-1,2-epoxide hydrolase